MPTTDRLRKEFTGNGIITPMARLGTSDFLSAYGAALVKSRISQVLGTRKGELPWRPDFGSDLDRFRHKNLHERDKSALVNEVTSILAKWEPAISLTNVSITSRGTYTYVRITWKFRQSDGSTIALPSTTQEEPL